MTAIDGLIEEAGEMGRECRKSIEPALIEIAGIDAAIQALVSIALDLQEQLSDLMNLRIEPAFPVEEEKEETGIQKDEAGYFQQNYMVNIGQVNFYPLSKFIGNTLKNFDTQKSEFFEIFSPGASFERPYGIQPGMLESLTTSSKKSLIDKTFQKKGIIENNVHSRISGNELSAYIKPAFSEAEINYDSLKRSAIIINELKTVGEGFASVSIQTDDTYLENDIILNRSKNSFEEINEGTEGIQKNENLDIKTFSENVRYISKIIRDVSNSLYGGISDINDITDLSLLERSLTVHSGPAALIENMTDAGSSHETFKSANIISEYSETMDMISKTLQKRGSHESIVHSPGNIVSKILQSPSNFSETVESMSASLNKSISEAQEITNISSLGKISARGSGPAGKKMTEKKPVIYTDQRILEIPAFRPSISIDDAAINISRLSNSISNKSHEKGSISISDTSDYVLKAFETISNYIVTASEVDRRTSEMTKGGAFSANSILWQSPLLNLTLSEGGNVALNLERLTIDRNNGLMENVQAANIAIGMASTDALEKAGSAAVNNIDLSLSQDYRIPSIMTGTNKNVLQIASSSQNDITGGTLSSNNTINFQNTFNIVIDMKNGGKETELRELGSKIGQILSDEIRRYGGIR